MLRYLGYENHNFAFQRTKKVFSALPNSALHEPFSGEQSPVLAVWHFWPGNDNGNERGRGGFTFKVENCNLPCSRCTSSSLGLRERKYLWWGSIQRFGNQWNTIKFIISNPGVLYSVFPSIQGDSQVRLKYCIWLQGTKFSCRAPSLLIEHIKHLRGLQQVRIHFHKKISGVILSISGSPWGGRLCPVCKIQAPQLCKCTFGGACLGGWKAGNWGETRSWEEGGGGSKHSLGWTHADHPHRVPSAAAGGGVLAGTL